jgi:TIR domain
VKVFVSYRRGDSADVTGRIHDRLVHDLGADSVFVDVDSIPLGADFRRHLESAVAACDVVLVVIGPAWLDATDDAGRSRLIDHSDFVRLEVESALARSVPVVPVLVRGATMPRPEVLPESIANLAYRQGTVVRQDPDFHTDMDRVIRALRAAALPVVVAATMVESHHPRWRMRPWLLWLVAAGAVALIALVVLAVRWAGDDSGSAAIGDVTTTGALTTTTPTSAPTTATTSVAGTSTVPATTIPQAAPTSPNATPAPPPQTAPRSTVTPTSTSPCPQGNEFRAVESGDFAIGGNPPDDMLLVLQMHIQGKTYDQILSICLDPDQTNYWYFNHGVDADKQRLGVVTPAHPANDGFAATYPNDESINYLINGAGVYVVQAGDGGPRPNLGLYCIDRPALPVGSFPDLPNVPTCSADVAQPWTP